MFKENRLIYLGVEHINVVVASEVAPHGYFNNLFKIVEQVYGKAEAQAKYKAI